jgi:transposase InsO family protein
MRELDVITWRGRPSTVVSDNGTEFTSNAILGFADRVQIDWHSRQGSEGGRSSYARTPRARQRSSACA